MDLCALGDWCQSNPGQALLPESNWRRRFCAEPWNISGGLKSSLALSSLCCIGLFPGAQKIDVFWLLFRSIQLGNRVDIVLRSSFSLLLCVQFVPWWDELLARHAGQTMCCGLIAPCQGLQVVCVPVWRGCKAGDDSALDSATCLVYRWWCEQSEGRIAKAEQGSCLLPPVLCAVCVWSVTCSHGPPLGLWLSGSLCKCWDSPCIPGQPKFHPGHQGSNSSLSSHFEHFFHLPCTE